LQESTAAAVLSYGSHDGDDDALIQAQLRPKLSLGPYDWPSANSHLGECWAYLAAAAAALQRELHKVEDFFNEFVLSQSQFLKLSLFEKEEDS